MRRMLITGREGEGVKDGAGHKQDTGIGGCIILAVTWPQVRQTVSPCLCGFGGGTGAMKLSSSFVVKRE